MKIKAPYFLAMLTLCVTMLLAACGESAPTTAPAAQPTTATTTTQASTTTAAAATSASATTAAAAKTTAPATKPATAAAGGSKPAKVNACELFSQGDAETALGVKVEQKPSKDNAAFYTCFYNTQDDGKLKLKDISYLSVLVYSKEASKSWYTSVKKEYEAQTAGKGLTPVAGLGNDAFSYVVDSGSVAGKGVHLGVLKGKTFFSITVDNTKLDEGQQLAQLKELAQKIAAKF